MSKKEQPIIKIDVDRAIELYNINNPKKSKMTRQLLFDLLDNKFTKTTLQNWKIGKVPYAFENIRAILKITGVKLSQVLTIEKDGKIL